jgi:type I restriction enzyme S subunit
MKWEKVKLFNLVEKPISGEWGTGEGNIKVIRSTNFTNNGTLDLSDVVSREIPLTKVEKKKLRHGDIIIEKSGGSPTQPVGRVVHFLAEDEEYLCNNFTSVLRPKANVCPRFLFWCLFSGHINGSTLKYQNKTTGIINLQLERYCKEFEVPLPPLHIQEQIVDTLDKADALRRKDQELLQKYDELAQAIFYDMFGDPVKNEKDWLVKTMNEICTKVTDGTHDTPERLIKGIPFITGKHIRPGIIDYTNCDFVSEKVHEEIYKRCNPEIGDVLYTNIGVNYGTAAINTVTYPFSMKNVALLKTKKDIILGEYLQFLLNDNGYKKRLLNESGVGGAQQFLSLKQIRSLKIVVPDINLQLQFVGLFKHIVKSRSKISVKKTTNLFDKMINKYFS